MWSNQVTQRFGFRVHMDGDDPASWSADEVPASQSALAIGHGFADDHINLAPRSNGELFAVVKTSYDNTGKPVIVLLKRQADGTWDDAYTVDKIGTRAIVMINEAYSFLTVVYSEDVFGGSVLYRESPLDTINFSDAHVLIPGGFLDADGLPIGGLYTNVSSQKDPFTNDLVVVASETLADGTIKVDGVHLQR